MKHIHDDRPRYRVTFTDGETVLTAKASSLAEAIAGWPTDRVARVERVEGDGGGRVLPRTGGKLDVELRA